MRSNPDRYGAQQLQKLNNQIEGEKERNRTMTAVRVKQIQEEAEDLIEQQQQLRSHQAELFKILIYKSKKVKLLPFSPCCAINFNRQNFAKANRFDLAMRFIILTLFFFEVCFTGIDLFANKIELYMAE